MSTSQEGSTAQRDVVARGREGENLRSGGLGKNRRSEQLLLQVARARMQQRLDGQKLVKYGTLPRTFVAILQQGGVRALYQGFVANAARTCPNLSLIHI